MRLRLLSLALAGMVPAVTPVLAQSRDEARTMDIVVTLGPVDLPARADHHDVAQPGFRTFTIPSAGWLEAYVVELRDASGRLLPRTLLHHCDLVDLERRELLRPEIQRAASMSSETPPLILPTSLGYPVRRGHALGLNAMLANPTDTSYAGVTVRVAMRLALDGGGARPRPILAVHADVPGDRPYSGSFTVPNGRTVKETEFTVPIAGTFLAVGGHLHNYGRTFTVVNEATGDTLYRALAQTRPDGRILAMPMAQLWAQGGVHVAAGARYRITALYDNPTGRDIPDGGMVTFGAIFVPDDERQWPALEWNNPETAADLVRLMSGHAAMPGMAGMAHGEGMHSHR